MINTIYLYKQITIILITPLCNVSNNVWVNIAYSSYLNRPSDELEMDPLIKINGVVSASLQRSYKIMCRWLHLLKQQKLDWNGSNLHKKKFLASKNYESNSTKIGNKVWNEKGTSSINSKKFK